MIDVRGQLAIEDAQAYLAAREPGREHKTLRKTVRELLTLIYRLETKHAARLRKIKAMK